MYNEYLKNLIFFHAYEANLIAETPYITVNNYDWQKLFEEHLFRQDLPILIKEMTEKIASIKANFKLKLVDLEYLYYHTEFAASLYIEFACSPYKEMLKAESTIQKSLDFIAMKEKYDRKLEKIKCL